MKDGCGCSMEGATFLDLAKEVEPPTNGILSRTLYADLTVKVVIFGIAKAKNCGGKASMFAILNLPTGELKCSGFIRSYSRHGLGFVALVAIYEGMCLPRIVSGSISS